MLKVTDWSALLETRKQNRDLPLLRQEQDVSGGRGLMLDKLLVM